MKIKSSIYDFITEMSRMFIQVIFVCLDTLTLNTDTFLENNKYCLIFYNLI